MKRSHRGALSSPCALASPESVIASTVSRRRFGVKLCPARDPRDGGNSKPPSTSDHAPRVRSVVRVAVVDVRIVRMKVHHRSMSMPMSMRRRISHRGVVRRMGVSMMVVVNVCVIMVQRSVLMLMLVPFVEM